MKHSEPTVATRNRQKTLASLLALGASPHEAAEQLGVSVTYVNVLLKGGLFQYEVDEARKTLIGERLNEYSKLVSEQLMPNLSALIAIRDDTTAKLSDRLRAIEMINAALVPRAQPVPQVTATVKYHLTPEQEKRAERALAETGDVPPRANRPA
jgi:hypothetical protein